MDGVPLNTLGIPCIHMIMAITYWCPYEPDLPLIKHEWWCQYTHEKWIPTRQELSQYIFHFTIHFPHTQCIMFKWYVHVYINKYRRLLSIMLSMNYKWQGSLYKCQMWTWNEIYDDICNHKIIKYAHMQVHLITKHEN